MKTTFKVKRGHVWHVVHETKTGTSRGSAWTLCGQYYHEGERDSHTPTCPGCLKVDNPLTLPTHAKHYLKEVARNEGAQLGRSALEVLVKSDYLTHEREITRRGAILIEDFHRGPVPLADEARVVHARDPLDIYPRCTRNGRLSDADQMTTDRYAKLRMVEDQLMVTCLQCIARGDPRDDVY